MFHLVTPLQTGEKNAGTCTPELIALFFHNHLEYITPTLPSTPKQVLAKAKTNTILQHLWMHFQNAELINQ